MGWLEIVVPGAFMKGFWLSKYSRLTEVIIKPLHSTTTVLFTAQELWQLKANDFVVGIYPNLYWEESLGDEDLDD